MGKPSLLSLFSHQQERAEHLQRTSKALSTLEDVGMPPEESKRGLSPAPSEAAGERDTQRVHSHRESAMTPSGEGASGEAAAKGSDGEAAAKGSDGEAALLASSESAHSLPGGKAGIASASPLVRSGALAGPLASPPTALSLPIPVPKQATTIDLMKWTTVLIVALVIGYVLYRIYKVVQRRRAAAKEKREAKAKAEGAAQSEVELHVAEKKSGYTQRIPNFLGASSSSASPAPAATSPSRDSAKGSSQTAEMKGAVQEPAAPSPRSAQPVTKVSEPTEGASMGSERTEGAAKGSERTEGARGRASDKATSAPQPLRRIKKAAPEPSDGTTPSEAKGSAHKEASPQQGAKAQASSEAETPSGGFVDDFLDAIQETEKKVGAGYPGPV